MSLTITDSAKDKVSGWVKNHEQLLNIATTRAKEELVLVCNTNLIRSKSSSNNDVLELIDYVSTKAFNSKSEAEMLNTLKQIASTKKGKLKIRTKDKIADWFDIQNHEFRRYFVAAHLVFVITNNDDEILVAIKK